MPGAERETCSYERINLSTKVATLQIEMESTWIQSRGEASLSMNTNGRAEFRGNGNTEPLCGLRTKQSQAYAQTAL